MQINPHVPFIPTETLEEIADALLDRYAREIEPIHAPPVPVEEIADFLLELGLEWLPIPDDDEAPILAYLHPASKTIRLNERRLDYFEQYPGMYQYTLAHEIGHYHLHLTGGMAETEQAFIYRHKQISKDRREWQAERFASYLLMPESLLLPAIEGKNLRKWPELYRLRDRFNVSITALKIRLEELEQLYVAPNGRIYGSQAAASAKRRQEMRELIGQGQFALTVEKNDEAALCYQQALEIAAELNDRQHQAFLAWQLGLLFVESDPAQAVALMSICVAYEQETHHPNAQADAALVAEIAGDR